MTGDVPSPGDPGLRLACQDVVELLTDYLDGVLLPPSMTEVESHLAVCPPCRTYLAQVEETVRRVGRLEATEQLCDEARADVIAAFRGIAPSDSKPQ